MKILSILVVAAFLIPTLTYGQQQSTQTRKALIDHNNDSKKPDSKNPVVYFNVNTAPAAVGIIAGLPVVPLDLGFRVLDGLSIGPMATISAGSYRYDDADLKLSGFGVQAIYNFGQRAIADGFFVKGFWQRYALSGEKQVAFNDGLGGNMSIPMDGSVPINAVGGGIGYQWVMESGLRIAVGASLAYAKTNSNGITLAGMNKNEWSELGAASNEIINIPALEDRSLLLPMPEISVGWAF